MNSLAIGPRLIAITDTTLAPAEVLLERCERVLASAAPGSVLLQLRDKELPLRERFALTKRDISQRESERNSI